MTIETSPFDAADHLRSPQAQQELLDDAFASGDPAYVAAALGTVAREALYKALSSDGDPRLSTLITCASSASCGRKSRPAARQSPTFTSIHL